LNLLLAAPTRNLPISSLGWRAIKSIQIRNPSEAAELQIRFDYDELTDTVVDQSNGDSTTTWTGPSHPHGKTIRPGFRAEVGFKNFRDFRHQPGPARTAGSHRHLELHLPDHQRAIHLCPGPCHCHHVQRQGFPVQEADPLLLLIPYTIPGLISIIMWRGMLNPNLG
jgi:hypothetical protein